MRLKFLGFFILLFVLCLPVLAGSFDVEVGDRVEVKGVVVVEPGILGKQIFYINGLQIYSYYKDFPELNIGDKISVIGIISQSRGEKRVKTKTSNDITIIKSNYTVPTPMAAEISEISDDLIGYLLKIKGLVIERTGPRIFVEGKSGKEVIVYIKKYTDIDTLRVGQGDKVGIVGILSRYNDELQVLPRSDQDIIILSSFLGVKPPKSSKSLRARLPDRILASGGELFDFEKYKPYFIISSIVLGLIFIILLVIRVKIFKT